MTGLYGLKQYSSASGTKKFSFQNFQWACKDVLARSSQPGYTGFDQTHTITKFDVSFLRHNKIRCVISANHCQMDDAGKQRLKDAGIAFYHFEVEDFKPPSPNQLERAAKAIEYYGANEGASLVYCGYGQGRTGTFVAGWAMMEYMRKQPGAIISNMCNEGYLRTNFGVENTAQVNAIRSAALGTTVPLDPGLTVGSSGSSNFVPPAFLSGPSGLGFPDDDNFSSPGFANFGSGISKLSF